MSYNRPLFPIYEVFIGLFNIFAQNTWYAHDVSNVGDKTDATKMENLKQYFTLF